MRLGICVGPVVLNEMDGLVRDRLAEGIRPRTCWGVRKVAEGAVRRSAGPLGDAQMSR
jgi:hypothetical protein